MERPSRGGEKRTAVWAAPHEARGRDGAVAPPMCDHSVILHRCVVREWGHPSEAAGAPGLHAAAHTRRAARAVQGDVGSVWQGLPGTPSAPPLLAQRVARFDHHCARNCLLQNKLRQRYSRYTKADDAVVAVCRGTGLRILGKRTLRVPERGVTRGHNINDGGTT
jgi:hypothetical protein